MTTIICDCPGCFVIDECSFDPSTHETCNCGGGGGEIHLSFFASGLSNLHAAPISMDDNYIPNRLFKKYDAVKAPNGRLIENPEGPIQRPDFNNNIHNAVYWYEKYANGGYSAIVLQMKEICQWPGTTIAKSIALVEKPNASSEITISSVSPNIPSGDSASDTVSKSTFGATISYQNRKLTEPLSCGCFVEIGPSAIEGQWGWISHDTRKIYNNNVIEIGGILVEAIKIVVQNANLSQISNYANNVSMGWPLDGPQGAMATPTTQWRCQNVADIESTASTSPKVSLSAFNSLMDAYNRKSIAFSSYRDIFNNLLPIIKSERTSRTAPTYDSLYVPGSACGCCASGDMEFINNGNCNGVCYNNGITAIPIVPISSENIYVKNSGGLLGLGLVKQTINPIFIPGMVNAITIEAINEILLPQQTGVDENGNPIIINIPLENYPTTICDKSNTYCDELGSIIPTIGTVSITGYRATQVDENAYMAGGVMVNQSAIVRAVTGITNNSGCLCLNRNSCFSAGQDWLNGQQCPPC